MLDRHPGSGWGTDEGPRAPPPSQARPGTLHGGRSTGVRDADLFSWDDDPSWEAEDRPRPGARPERARGGEDAVLRQARVHLWYADRFGTAAPAPFRSCTDAVDAFAAVCCAVAVTVRDGRPRVYAPYGLDDVLGLVVRPDPASPAPREVYETRAARWRAVWPELTVLPWDARPPR